MKHIGKYIPGQAGRIENFNIIFLKCEIVMSWGDKELWWDHLLTNSSLDPHDGSAHNMLFFEQKG